jgi:hypothetical protein
MRCTRTLAGLLLGAGLLLAACGGDDGGAGVASLGGSTTTTAKDGTGAQQSQEDALIDYVRCLRKAGVEVDDPQPVSASDDGTIPDEPPDGAPGDQRGRAVMQTSAGRIELPGPDDPVFKKADATCHKILDAAEQSRPAPSAEEVAEQRDKALKFAQCMRDKGVDMPDPVVDDKGRISISIGVQKGSKLDGKKVQAAQKECQEKYSMGPKAAGESGSA